MSSSAASLRTLLVWLLMALSAFGEPRRIVSTAPSITETLYALGLGSRVVGVTQYCTYPPEARRVTSIGTWVSPNLETIVSLRPDLLIVQKTAVHGTDKFRSLGLKTLEADFISVDDIFRSIGIIGEAAGVPGKAALLRTKLKGELDGVRKRVAGLRPPKTLFIVGRNPGTLEGLIAVGPGSYQSEMLELAGGRNVLSDSPRAYAKVLQEEIVARNPDVIIDMGQHADAAELTEQQRNIETALWNRFANIAAVRNRRVYIVSSDLFVHPGPRVAELAKEFGRLLHPEAFR